MNGDFPPNVVELIQRQLTQFGRVGATKIYAAPDLPAALAAGTNSPPLNIQFKEPGSAIAFYAQSVGDGVADATAFATTRVKVEIGGQENIFTDGQVGVFRSLLALVGGAQNWFPIWRRVTPGIDWTVTWQNLSEVTVVPEFSIAVIADADLARQMPPRPNGPR